MKPHPFSSILFALLPLLWVGCSFGSTGTITDPFSGAIVAPPEKDVSTYLTMLPWILTFCGLGVFIFGWYTPSPKDNIPCSVIFGVLLALAFATAQNGPRMAIVCEIACYVSAIVCVLFFVKGYVQKNYINNSDKTDLDK